MAASKKKKPSRKTRWRLRVTTKNKLGLGLLFMS